MEFPNKKYQIIYADPPWDFGGGGVYQDNNRPLRKTKDQYPLMKIKDLLNLPVEQIAADDALLFMWTTDQHIPDALKLIDAWGFKYCTVAFYWVKKTNKGNTCFNVGCWTMKSVEQVFLGLRGKAMHLKKTRNIKQLVEAERTIHSKKPKEVMDRIVELVGDLPRVELFARQQIEGWDSLGFDLNGVNIKESLTLLCK